MTNEPRAYDLVAIGDITTDAFIRLQDAAVHCSIDNVRCELCVEFGAKIPYEFVEVVPAVGNCANAAVAAARLGLASALITNQGDDEVGHSHLEVLARGGVADEFVTSHAGKATNYHYVLWFESERTILVKHNQYAYRFPREALDARPPRWLYLTSLGNYAASLHDESFAYLVAHPEVRLAFQPGTFQISLGADKLGTLYHRADIFFCNKEEAQKILGTTEPAARSLAAGLRALGPKIVVITDGPAGAYADDGTVFWFMPPYPDPKPPYERTGAGDAFASTVTAALALDLPLAEALRWGAANSMAVVQEVGAQKGLLTREKLEGLLAAAPDSFAVRRP